MLAKPPFSYLETLDRTDAAIDSNASLARAIVQYGLESLGVSNPSTGGAEENQMMIPKEWIGVAKPSESRRRWRLLDLFYIVLGLHNPVIRDGVPQEPIIV